MLRTWETITIDELRVLINSATFTDCIIYDEELRIGTKEGNIRITLGETSVIKHSQINSIKYPTNEQ